MAATDVQEPFEWLFESLWLAGDASAEPCRVRVPDTILFVAGTPRKWVSYAASGRVVRRYFDAAGAVAAAVAGAATGLGGGGSRSSAVAAGGGVGGSRAEHARIRAVRLLALRHAFIEFLDDRDLPFDGAAPFAVVWYTPAAGGGREEISLAKFDSLTQHEMWLARVLAMQVRCACAEWVCVCTHTLSLSLTTPRKWPRVRVLLPLRPC